VNSFFRRISQHYENPVLTATLVVTVLGICAILCFKGWRIARAIILVLTVLGICVLSFWGRYLGGPDKWNILTAVTTLLAVVVALFLDDIRTLLHRPEIDLHIGRDLIDDAGDFDARDHAQWVRGKIKNIDDRGVERCRLKLLNVEGQNIPQRRVR
jgi:hypothetical protein